MKNIRNNIYKLNTQSVSASNGVLNVMAEFIAPRIELGL